MVGGGLRIGCLTLIQESLAEDHKAVFVKGAMRHSGERSVVRRRLGAGVGKRVEKRRDRVVFT